MSEGKVVTKFGAHYAPILHFKPKNENSTRRESVPQIKSPTPVGDWPGLLKSK